ncbi:MAG: tetratricopeptide repeat protein [Gammaproteobacteria bacterium]|nr:tetratricopeptide repeat protein [Gammaproteobacteria bacterium]
MTKRNTLIIGGSLAILLAIVFVVLSRQHTDLKDNSNSSVETLQEQVTQRSEKSTPVLSEATYVGRQQCASCHPQQLKQWQGSHHDLAMQEVTAQNVLGDFNNTTFTYYDVTSSFYKKDGKFYVKTDNADGKLKEFEIKYTFGVTPLQQYLIEFPRGRMQMLNVAWDSRSKEAGGQRWFHLYPNENVDHSDALHWTGVFQNWNNMCAECHSTELKKNYDYASDTYKTTWFEIDVSCEACHGPASNHVKWAQALAEGEQWEGITNKGLLVILGDPKNGQWQLGKGQNHASRTDPFDTGKQLQTCARCHSRRAVFNDDYRHGQPLMDTHVPSLLTEELYYPDGQIKDEVYVYGSFIQSKMYQAGVICSDCHNPHSLQLKVQGNGLCTRCHNADIFEAQKHHHHPENSSGSQCISCHMPQTKYMVVDPRADHSMRIPRPDLSDELGSPNACIMCHTKKSNSWAAQSIVQWQGGQQSQPKHYGQILHAARNDQPQADIELAQLILDTNQPGIVRATALSMLRNYAYPRIEQLLDQVYQDPDPLIRNSVAEYLETVDPSMRVKHAGVLLNDPVRAVRMSAARTLMDTPANLLSKDQQKAVQQGIEEYLSAQQYNADRPEGRTNLGSFYMALNNPDKAEEYFKAAIDLGPALAQAYVNLADLYRLQQREQEGEAILRLGLKQSENKAPIHHALGLLLVRQQKIDAALAELKQAAELAPNQSRYAYVYGVALQSKSYDEAIKYLEKASQRHPGDLNILFTLASYYYENDNPAKAEEYTEKVLVLAPQHRGAQQLMMILNR